VQPSVTRNCHPHLFTPITLGGVTFANRIAVSPMCQYSANDGAPNDWHAQHLASLSMSGAGLLIVEMTAVEPEGRITRHCLGLYSDANEAAFEPILATCRRWGTAKLGIQLAHAGRKGSARMPWEGGKPLAGNEGAWQTYASSAIPFDEGWHTPQALDEAGWRASATGVSPARGGPTDSVSSWSSCTARTAICCTILSRRSPTGATMLTAAASPTACGFRSRSQRRCARCGRATRRSACGSPAPTGSTAG
jgi:hypothetical protein